MITMLLACASSPDAESADTGALSCACPEAPSGQPVVETVDLGACTGAGEWKTVHVPDGEMVGFFGVIAYDDGRTFYRSDTSAYVQDDYITVQCAEGQSVTVTWWVIRE